MRIGVIDFAAHAPAVLQTDAGLESIVVPVGVVLFRLQVAVSLVSEEGVSAAVEGAQSGRAGVVIHIAAHGVVWLVVVSGIAGKAGNGGGAFAAIDSSKSFLRADVVAMHLDVLVPCKVAHVLNHPDDGRGQFVLHAEGELGNSRSAIVLLEERETAGRKDWQTVLGGRNAVLEVVARVAPCGVAEAEIVGEGRGGSGIVDVVALHAFIEGSEAAAEHGFSVSKEVFGEADTGLEGVVVVLDQALGEAVLTRETHAIEVERNAVDGLNTRAGGIDSAAGGPDGERGGVIQ